MYSTDAICRLELTWLEEDNGLEATTLGAVGRDLSELAHDLLRKKEQKLEKKPLATWQRI